MNADLPWRERSAADAYERIAVPAVFDRCARDLVERARPIGPSERILDLGCGTGIVARILRERLGGAASIVGVDASAAMIEKARSIAPELDFREGDALCLPFARGAFDLVLSQQMLQFVPHLIAALREVRRVLSPGGRLIASSWSLDANTLGSAITKVGFTDICIETVSLGDSADLLARFVLDARFGGPSVANIATAKAPRNVTEA